MDYLRYLAGPLAAILIMGAAFAIAFGKRRSSLGRSLAAYGSLVGLEDLPLKVKKEAKERGPGAVQAWGVAAVLNVLVSSRGERVQGWLGRELGRADIDLTVQEASIAVASATVGGALVGLLLFHGLVGAVAGLLGAAVLLYAGVRFKQKRRLKKFGDQLPEVLAVLTINLRAGLSILQALDNMSRQVRAPAGVEFGSVIRESRVGVPVDRALRNMATRIDNQDLHLLVNAIAIQRETGGNLIQMMETIEHTVRERVLIRGEVKTLTAQTQMGSWIITGLPIVLAFFLYTINPQGISFFWTNLLGIVLGGVTVLCIVAGNLVLQRITNIEL